MVAAVKNKITLFKAYSLKTQLILFLTAFAIFLSIKDRDWLFLLNTSLACSSAVIVELFFMRLKYNKIVFTESSLISGLIIGFVLYSKQPWWVFTLAASIAIASKHLLRIQHRHLLNPAAFGIFLATALFSAQTQWRGTYLWYILLPIGLYFSYRIHKLELITGYFLGTFLLFGTQALMQKLIPIVIFGYLSYFYIFIMIIEPKTTPVNKPGKFLFGMGVAALIFIFTEIKAGFDVELAALLVLNLFVPLLNKINPRRIQ